MLSEDQAGPATDKPSALDVRKYDTATHAFGAPLVVQAFAQSDTGLFDGGDLAENARTGELAAVWPVSSNGSSFLRAYLSSDRGASFSPGQEIASIGSEYTIYNSARVGIANNGQGFATFQDHDGLHIADLTPLGGWVGLLSDSVRAISGRASMGLTCRAPRFETCGGSVSFVLPRAGGARSASAQNARRATLASGRIRIAGAKTKRIRLRLTGAARRRLAANRGRLRATLILLIRTPSRVTTSRGSPSAGASGRHGAAAGPHADLSLGLAESPCCSGRPTRVRGPRWNQRPGQQERFGCCGHRCRGRLHRHTF